MNTIFSFYLANKDWLGDIGTWVSGLGIVATFVIGFIQIHNERKIRKEKERKEQAERISVFIFKETPAKTTIALLNLSPEPIYEVIVSISIFQGAVDSTPSKSSKQFTSFLSVVPPGKSFTFVDGDYRGMSFHPAVEIAFKDVKGKSWVRSARGSLREISKSSVEHYTFHQPLNWKLPEHEM
ncbi:MAG TPA: hypothetical protein VLF93_01170 [Candidatus Saccharimonadales bacterium]|nr:hypothetical protein [Candidatus Saccharimonadales bacterium]